MPGARETVENGAEVLLGEAGTERAVGVEGCECEDGKIRQGDHVVQAQRRLP